MRDKLITTTALMQQTRKLGDFGTSIRIASDELEVLIHREDSFIGAVKALGQPVSCKDIGEKTKDENFKYEWSFIYNGVKFFTLKDKEYQDAETTEGEI